MGLKQIIANKAQSCAVASLSTRNAQLLDDLSQNTRNPQRNHSATTHFQPLENKDSIRNLPRNYDATVQKTDAQLSPLKMPQKLRSENSELRGALSTLSAIGGGDNPVISANSLSNEATNDNYENIVVKPVIQKLVRQVDEVSTNGENLLGLKDSLVSVADNSAVKMQDIFPSSIHYPKSAVENRLTQSEETYPQTVDEKHSQIVEVYPHIEDGQLSPMEEVNATFGVRYAHLIKCQQCEHLTLTGYCRVKPQVKPIPEAMIDCASFGALKSERTSEVRNEPYTQSELNALLGDCEKKLFQHFVKGCDGCSFMDGKYCSEVFKSGRRYDDLLLSFDDAASKREALLNTVIRARISGRKVFVGLDYRNIGEPQQQAVKPLVYGIGDSERLFVNHLMSCKRCKPVSRSYCGEGLKLKAKAGS